MRILLSNDDGIDAPGLLALEVALAPLGEVWVVAPADEQSAMSHSLTMNRPLRIREHGERRFSLSGTPADTIYVALHHILDVRPDLVVSGINRGANLGYDVHYSGTVAAAREACIQGIPAIAVSAHSLDGMHRYDTAALVAARVVQSTIAQGMADGVCLNVNVPPVAPEALLGIRACVLGRRMYDSSVEMRLDPRGQPYVWIGGPHRGFEGDENGDARSVDGGWAAVTP
jgi:5'-nucleotidase